MAGIVDAINIDSAYGAGDVDLSIGELKAGPFKVSLFKWVPRVSGQGAPKLQTPGNWPALHDPRELVIDLEGQLVATSPEDYWSQRNTLMTAIFPPPDYDRSIRHHSTITMTVSSTELYVDVNLADYDLPLQSQGGRWTEMRFSWVAHFGYWRQVSDDEVVLI